MPLVTGPLDTTHRHVLLIGTTTNQPGWSDISEGVRTELDRARRLFVNELGYRNDTFRELVNPDSAALKKDVAGWRASIDLGPDDWLLVYYTGHGVERAGMLQLITSDIAAKFPETAPNAQDLVTALVGAAHPNHILLIIDTCQSAAAQLDLPSTAARLREAEGGAARGADFHVITTARSVDTASTGHFIEALAATLTSGTAAGADEEHAQLGPVLGRVNEILAKAGRQRAGYAGAGERASRFFPNPSWVPRLQKNMEPATRTHVLHGIQAIALRSHWDPRARGVATDADAGWFFTGRSRAIQRIVQWLTAANAGPALVVKGLPGSGKSAVLARIVTLADAEQRERARAAGVLDNIPAAEIPPEGSIHVAVHARAKDPSQLALEIGAALQLETSERGQDPEAATIDALRMRADRVVVAIDALDEAQRPYDCAAFLRRLLKRAPYACLLIGVRSSGDAGETLVHALGGQIEPLDLDSPDWYDPADSSRYVERYLVSSADSVYASAPAETVRRLAEAISKRAGTSFLVASVTAHALAGRTEIPELDADGDWLPATVGEALALDLARFSGSAGEQIRAILWALAWAFGRGIPTAEWLALARVRAEEDLSEADLDRWSRDAGFYIVSDQEFGAPVRRLYHEEFARHLLHSGVQVRDIALIPQALLALVPPAPETTEPNWEAASSHLLMYYPAYLWALGHGHDLLEVATSPGWIDAKRQRFSTPEPVLVDLGVVADIARQAFEPPDLPAIVRACAIYTRFSSVAPPLAIDVLAGLGQRGRAELMAGNIEFPLDRCHAFSLLAIRYAQAGNTDKAASCLRIAERAAETVRGHFSSMAWYWIADAAQRSELAEFSTAATNRIRALLEQLRPADPDVSLIGTDTAKLTLQLWAHDRWEEDKAFAVPHWLFWAAMCLREVGDEEGLARIRATLAALQPYGNNLALQTAAVARDYAYLGSVQPVGIVKPRNLALALLEAGLIAEFDGFRKAGAFDAYDFADAAKRYAWALARRGDTSAALTIADTIENDPEEQARAYYRLSQVALKTGDREFANEIASRAKRLSEQTTDPSDDARRWRLETWIAPVMLVAGRNDEARRLAESICDAGIAPSRENSLAMATPRTARAKGHVRFDSPVDVDEGVVEAMLQVAATSGIASARKTLSESGATHRTEVLTLAALARVERDAAAAYALWLDALARSRFAGRRTLMEVTANGTEVLGRVHSTVTSDDLRALVAAVDEEFARSGGHVQQRQGI